MTPVSSGAPPVPPKPPKKRLSKKDKEDLQGFREHWSLHIDFALAAVFFITIWAYWLGYWKPDRSIFTIFTIVLNTYIVLHFLLALFNMWDEKKSNDDPLGLKK